MQWQFVRRDQVGSGAVGFGWVATNRMATDGLSKALTGEKFVLLIGQIGPDGDHMWTVWVCWMNIYPALEDDID